MENIANYVKTERKKIGWTQERFAMYAGVSTKFLIELEGGKKTLRMDKVLAVLRLLDATLVVKERAYEER